MKTCYAIYRQPEEGLRCNVIDADACLPISSAEMDELTGFVIAPFEESPSTPMVLIQGVARSILLQEDKNERVEDSTKPETKNAVGLEIQQQALERTDYHDRFARFHAAIRQGQLTKVILSRRSRVERLSDNEPMELFRRACATFPHCFIALFHTSETGTWLTATPEVLLKADGQQAQTMALAGTMRAPDNEIPTQAWSEKNRKEQQYVADYIRERLDLPADRLSVSAARTFVAGNVAHLRSDFNFTLSDIGTLGETVRRLHPTPAVCGLPTEEARRFILENEGHPRAYYSGYCGPLRQQQATSLYVMLRCMHICPPQYDLYAGGGLVKESTEEEEWQETEAKLYAMRATLAQI